LHVANDSRINLTDETATAAFASRLAVTLSAGLVIFLNGDLGAGKTTLVRRLLQSLGYTGRVKSPTYTLIEQYEVSGLHLRHFDLYRFRAAEEWQTTGFRDEFNSENICLVEWPQQAAGLIPQADLEITFEILTHGRMLDLQANTEVGKRCLNALAK
jgi:tRNA threonylcarbamoyladenosine biosynthesis protein TsaE